MFALASSRTRAARHNATATATTSDQPVWVSVVTSLALLAFFVGVFSFVPGIIAKASAVPGYPVYPLSFPDVDHATRAVSPHDAYHLPRAHLISRLRDSSVVFGEQLAVAIEEYAACEDDMDDAVEECRICILGADAIRRAGGPSPRAIRMVTRFGEWFFWPFASAPTSQGDSPTGVIPPVQASLDALSKVQTLVAVAEESLDGDIQTLAANLRADTQDNGPTLENLDKAMEMIHNLIDFEVSAHTHIGDTMKHVYILAESGQYFEGICLQYCGF